MLFKALFTIKISLSVFIIFVFMVCSLSYIKKLEIIDKNNTKISELNSKIQDIEHRTKILEQHINKSKLYAKEFKIDTTLAIYIYFMSTNKKINPAIVFSIISIESDFNTNSKSNKNARGLMQVKPATAEIYGVRGYDLYNTKENLKAGINHLEWCLKIENNNLVRALERYNKGNKFSTTNYADKVLRRASFTYIKQF